MKQLCLVLFAAMILMEGCIPFRRYEYYQPSAEEGVTKKSTCNESSGPRDTIEFKRNNVIIKVKIIASKMTETIHVFVTFRIPKDRTVRLESPVAAISTTPNSMTATGAFTPVLYAGQQPWSIDEEMVGDTKESDVWLFGPTKYDSYYAMNATVASKKSDNMILQLPSLFINGIKVHLPVIHFRKDKFIELFGPINC